MSRLVQHVNREADFSFKRRPGWATLTATLHLIVKELWYRRGNGLLGLAGVTATVALFVAFFTLAEASQRETVRVMRDLGFNVRIIPRDTDMDRFWTEGFSEHTMPEEAVRRLASHKDVFLAYNHLVATLQQPFEVAGKRVLLTGVAPAITAPAQRKQPMGFQLQPGRLILGAQVARRLGLKKGDGLKLGDEAFTVQGCLVETGTPEDVTLYGALADVQRVLRLPGRINEIKAIDCLCLTAAQEPLRALRAELERALPEAKVVQLRAMADARGKQRQTSARYFNFVTPLLLSVCAAWVALLAAQNVRERRAEIGVLRALGHDAGRVLGLFLGKAALLGLAGAAAGYGLGTALALEFGPEIFQVTASAIKPEGALLGWSLLLAPALAALASFIPALLAASLDPAVALREE
jgi:putative ABC transport system permease protein